MEYRPGNTGDDQLSARSLFLSGFFQITRKDPGNDVYGAWHPVFRRSKVSRYPTQIKGNTARKFVFFEEKIAIIELELKLCGYFCIITSEKMTAKQALELYKGRDASEKLFLADKPARKMTFKELVTFRRKHDQSVCRSIYVN